MNRASETVVTLLFTCLGLIACGGPPSPAATPSEAEAVQEKPLQVPATEPAPSSSSGEGTRGELTAEACEASGGKVVGDIGDGAIHRADYRCPSGAEPSGNIRAPEGGPMGVEGSVCCPQ